MDNEPIVSENPDPKHFYFICFVLLGLVFVWRGFHKSVATYELLKTAATHQGTLKHRYSSDFITTGKRYDYYVEFHVGETTYTCYDSLRPDWMVSWEGTVTVYYDPDNPWRAQIGPLWWIWLKSTFWLVMGAFIILVVGYRHLR